MVLNCSQIMSVNDLKTMPIEDLNTLLEDDELLDFILDDLDLEDDIDLEDDMTEPENNEIDLEQIVFWNPLYVFMNHARLK